MTGFRPLPAICQPTKASTAVPGLPTWRWLHLSAYQWACACRRPSAQKGAHPATRHRRCLVLFSVCGTWSLPSPNATGVPANLWLFLGGPLSYMRVDTGTLCALTHRRSVHLACWLSSCKGTCPAITHELHVLGRTAGCFSVPIGLDGASLFRFGLGSLRPLLHQTASALLLGAACVWAL
jgi:hypothetical protein